MPFVSDPVFMIDGIEVILHQPSQKETRAFHLSRPRVKNAILLLNHANKEQLEQLSSMVTFQMEQDGHRFDGPYCHISDCDFSGKSTIRFQRAKFEEVRVACKKLSAMTPKQYAELIAEKNKIRHGRTLHQLEVEEAREQTTQEEQLLPTIEGLRRFLKHSNAGLPDYMLEKMQTIIRDSILPGYPKKFHNRNPEEYAQQAHVPIIEAFFLGMNRPLDDNEVSDLRRHVDAAYYEQQMTKRNERLGR